MFEQVVQAVRAGRSPLLFTGIEGDKLGKNALWDREQFGDPLLIPSSFSFDRKLPVVENGVLIERIVAALEHQIEHGDLDRMAAFRRSKRTL